MFDFHTHNLQAVPGTAIVNLPREALLHPAGFSFVPNGLYSAGIHPWWTEDAAAVEAMRRGLEQLAEMPQVVALGECGFDRLRGNQDLQPSVFEAHVALAEAVRKPLIVHCVRAFDLLLHAHKALRPTTQWTVHGFRGNPALAQQLLAAGMDLSYGSRYNTESYALTPPARRHRETDEDF